MKLTILIALFLTSTASVHAAETLGKIVGQLGMAEGEVYVDSKEVKKNSPLREGSVVEVKKGKATLLLGSGSVFHLSANSKMTVKQFGMRADTNKEGGDVALSFGRTRALILNKGSETKDVRIQTRTATMGVRGTEIFIDAPKDVSQPVQFFTLEGLASVKPADVKLPSMDVKQNQGVSTAKGAGPAAEVKAGAAVMTVAEVKNEIKSDQMQITSINTPGDIGVLQGEFVLDQNPLIPAPKFDPIQDRLAPIAIVPKFCNATGAGLCP